MDTAQHHTAATRCLVFLHPAAASNPQIIREIHAATGLIAVADGNPHAARLVKPARSVTSSAAQQPIERPLFSVEDVCRWAQVPLPGKTQRDGDDWGPFGGGAA